MAFNHPLNEKKTKKQFKHLISYYYQNET